MTQPTAYICTNCPEGRKLYERMRGTPGVEETGCLGHCQYTPRVDIVSADDEKRFGSKRIGEPLDINSLGKNPRRTIEKALASK